MSKHFKRVLALLLTLVMIIGMLPTIAFAADKSADVWSQILDLEAATIRKTRGIDKITADDYAAIAGDVAMVFRFASPNKTGLSVKVSYNGKTITSLGSDTVQMTVGNTLGYSVSTYVCAKQADNDANLAALVKALYNYGASAKAYNPA